MCFPSVGPIAIFSFFWIACSLQSGLSRRTFQRFLSDSTLCCALSRLPCYSTNARETSPAPASEWMASHCYRMLLKPLCCNRRSCSNANDHFGACNQQMDQFQMKMPEAALKEISGRQGHLFECLCPISHCPKKRPVFSDIQTLGTQKRQTWRWEINRDEVDIST